MRQLEASPHMCFRYLKDCVEDVNKDGKQNKFSNDSAILDVYKELKRQSETGFAVHPKMEKLKMLLIQHFGQRMPDEDGAARPSVDDSTRAMVFVTNRAAISEIVEYLSHEKPLIRPTQFIGQGTDKEGNKGLLQREQLDVRVRFV